MESCAWSCSWKAQEQSWFGGTTCFTLLFPEALGHGEERMCRAAVFEGNRLSACRSFPSLQDLLATLSPAQQRDLDLQERLFLQDLCPEPVSPRGQGCREGTAWQRRILAGCCFTELKSFGILACFRAFSHLQHTELR